LVVVAEPLSNRAWSIALVGRMGARAALRGWITEAAGGDFRLVAISGPAGIGKSRMLAWAADEHRRRRGVVWLGHCSPELSPPFAPMMAAVGTQWPLVADAAGDDRLHVASSFDQPELNQVRALADLLAQETGIRPVMLALDDVHWADPGTLGVLEQLVYVLAARVATGCRVTVVVAHRAPAADSHVQGVLARLAREPTFRSLSLDPLDEVEVHELIRRLIAAAPDRRLVQRVHEASAGNPLVAIAATDAALSPGADHQPLGRTVDDVMARRLERLTGPAVRVAVALAVNARPAHPDDLAAMSGLPGDDCADGFDELERAGLVALRGDRCELVSPHVAEAVLAGSTTRQRQAAHGRIAELLRSATPPEADLLALAHHLERAGPRYARELAEVASAAAERAFAAGAWGSAAHLYEIALDHIGSPDPMEVAALEEKAGIASFRDFDRPRCEQHLTAAVELAEAHGDPVLAARATMWLARRRFTSGTEAAGHWIDVAPLERIVASRDVPVGMRAQAHGLIAEIAFQASDLSRARHHAAEARLLAIAAGEDFVGFWVAASDGLAHLGLLEVGAAARAFREADRCVRRSGQGFVRAAGSNRLALTELVRADLEAADRLAAGAAADGQAAANWSEHAFAETTRAIVAALQGRFDDHEDHAELARVSCGRSSTTYTPLVLHAAAAWGCAARGDREGASSALDELDAAGGRSGRYRLALELMTDEPDLVRKHLSGHAWRSHPPALTVYDAGAHAAQLELAIHAGNQVEVRAGCTLFEHLHTRGGRVVVEWPSLVARLIAEAKLCLGQPDEAARWVARAERLATVAGARVELARLDVIRAGLLLANGDDESVRSAVERIDRATHDFDALGMLRFARIAQALFDLPPTVDRVTRRLRPRAVLFTDIVDSTPWNVRLGDDHWMVLMAEHNRLARREVRRQRGTVVKTTGDGICAWFSVAADAIDCAVALQRAFDEFGYAHPETPIRIRCGIAIGDVFDLDGDLTGLAVTQAARICAAAGSSEIVTSADVRQLDGRRGRRYRPLGPHQLKGLPDAVPLFSVAV
jgi:class 3 adenylate cyclase